MPLSSTMPMIRLRERLSLAERRLASDVTAIRQARKAGMPINVNKYPSRVTAPRNSYRATAQMLRTRPLHRAHEDLLERWHVGRKEGDREPLLDNLLQQG